MKNFIKLSLAALMGITIASSGVILANTKETTVEPANASVATYYQGISDDLTGDDLVTALHNLNTSKKTRSVGYAGFRQFAAKCDKEAGGTKIVGFYDNQLLGPDWDSGSTWNREHVWPKSRNGSAVEDDAHMVRAASTKTNGDRGNKFFATGVYDPGEFVANYRGIAARIIFYCCIADTSLHLVDLSDDSQSNGTMGKLSDLLKWNLEYLPSTASNAPLELRVEQNRNNVIEQDSSGQGNRNPFIDHPEYACKIWGNTNDETKKICSIKPVPPTSITVTLTSNSIAVGATTQATATVNEDATNTVFWSTSNASVAKVDSTGRVTGLAEGTAVITATSTIDGSVKGTASVTVKAVKGLEMTGTATKLTYEAGQGFDPTGLTIKAVYTDESKVDVTSDVRWEPNKLYEGLTSVTGKYGDFSVVVEGLTVNPGSGNYTLVEKAEDLVTGDKVVIANKSAKATAGSLTSAVLSKVTSTFSSDGKLITELGDGSLEFTVEKVANGFWTFTTNEGKMTSTTEKKISFVTSDSGWELSFSSGNCTMKPSNNSSFSLQYNSNSPRFTTYKSNQQPIQLYRSGKVAPITHVQSVELDIKDLTLDIGGTQRLRPLLLPAEADNKLVTWTSSDDTIATVDTGLVTAIAPGVAIITVTSVDGGITDTCKVTVNGSVAPELVSLQISGFKTEFLIGDTLTFGGTVTAHYSDGTSSDVTALASFTGFNSSHEGNVTITVTYSENGVTKSTTYEIHVSAKPVDSSAQGEAGGCGGSIVAGSTLLAITSFLGFGLLITKKKFSK